MKTYFILSALVLLSSCASNSLKFDEYTFAHRSPANFQDCFKVMEKFFTAPPATASSFVYTPAKSLDELEASYGNLSLIDIQQKLSPGQIKISNKRTMTLLEQPLKNEQPDGYTNYATDEELALIYKELESDKVHLNHACYDPQGTVGFCFGRATIAHMEALIRGMNPDAIRKIWIAGDMKQWGHHVATMIKGEKGWYVIDTNIGRPVTADEWLAFYQPFKSQNAKDIMVFVTRADRFGPYDTQSYTGINLFNSNTSHYERTADFYRGYFYDYFEALDKERLVVKKFPVRK